MISPRPVAEAQTRADVHRVADDVVLATPPTTEVRGDRLTGVQADAKRDLRRAAFEQLAVELRRELLDRDRALQRHHWVVVRRDRRTPDREHFVADVLHQCAAHREHQLGDAVVVVVEHHANGRRRKALGERGEPAEVTEEHGHIEALTVLRELGAVLVDEPPRDGLRDVLREE